ncbi:uncharacterized protein LOC113129757 [Mastacembelus armatus]|uniref:uncharacterized protein LOC113129757 n=1 Tax=Mastacembelus armatus TaxID=205130 RepID=UPI000E46250C|nr:uncharacterized protein LOC113129757 [Mastacembelus armatus]
MKITWYLYILWSVSALGLLCGAADTYEFPSTGKTNIFKLGTPKSKSIKPSTIGDRKSRPPHSVFPVFQPSRFLRNPRKRLPDVSVTCSTSDFVLRVRPFFYGLGADAEELNIGSNCKSNGVLSPYGDLLFTYPMTACDAVRELSDGYLVYKFVLHYEPSPKRFPSGAHRIDINIECRYQRTHHVYQLAVKPTWPTAVVRKRLKGRASDFQIEMMDDSWNKTVGSQVYQLGKTMNFQVSARQLPTGGKLNINSCYAAPSSYNKSSIQYTVIDNYGCLLDSKIYPGASQFISRTDKTVRFSLRAFQFTADPDTEVRVDCDVSVTSEDPGPTHKFCTYRENGWKALTGDDSICECCDTVCVTSRTRRAVIAGSASSRSWLVLSQLYTGKDGFLPISKHREGESIITDYTGDMYSQEYLRESADVEEYDDVEEEKGSMEEELVEDEEGGSRAGIVTEPDLDTFGVRDGGEAEKEKESDVRSHELENGSVNKVDESSESEEQAERSEERADEEQVDCLNQKGEALHHWAPWEPTLTVGTHAELLKPNSKDEEENGEKVARKKASVVESKRGLADVEEVTWYSLWR